jgi:hypothetical protein
MGSGSGIRAKANGVAKNGMISAMREANFLEGKKKRRAVTPAVFRLCDRVA